MSIFKSTLKPEIAAQLKAREKIISQTSDSGVKDKKGNPIFNIGTLPRDSNFLRFVAGKNSWVRMVSFVNYNSRTPVDLIWGLHGSITSLTSINIGSYGLIEF